MRIHRVRLHLHREIFESFSTRTADRGKSSKEHAAKENVLPSDGRFKNAVHHASPEPRKIWGKKICTIPCVRYATAKLASIGMNICRCMTTARMAVDREDVFRR